MEAVKPCWRYKGLTAEGARKADEMLPLMQQIVDSLGDGLARAVLDEAAFRFHELPNRTKSFQRKYMKENG